MSTAISPSNVTLSRDSDDYTASRHIIQKMKLNERSITPEMIKEAIEEGEPVEAQRGDDGLEVVLRHKWGAMHYEVVVSVETETVVTAYESGTNHSDD